MTSLNQYFFCTDERKEHGYAQKMTHTDQEIQYFRVLQSVALCLSTSTEALEQIPHDELHGDDQTALLWMHTSLDDMLATIHGLLQARDHRYPQINVYVRPLKSMCTFRRKATCTYCCEARCARTVTG
ncbi:hypothetical protein H4V95_002244 [Arthrobacter sp. CAN_C5]|nr:hypothetical protein [Arthrobacter sp. CAN_C5]